ncbi:MAG: TOBE domain-containing protein [Bacillota bacterium]
MNNGQIEQQGKANKVFQKPASNFVANFLRAKNVFQVQASGKNHALIKGKETDLKIRVIDNFKGKANLTIRPEDIIISIDPFYSSARNIFRGIIKEIRNKLNYLEVLVDIGVDLRVNITRQSLIEFELKRDKEVYITFKASAVHIY